MNCTECDAKLTVPADAMQGEIITCPDCGSAFELVRTAQGTWDIRPAQVEGEDWGE